LLNEPFPQFFNLLNYAHGNATRNQNVGQDNAKEEKPEKKKITTQRRKRKKKKKKEKREPPHKIHR